MRTFRSERSRCKRRRRAQRYLVTNPVNSQNSTLRESAPRTSAPSAGAPSCSTRPTTFSSRTASSTPRWTRSQPLPVSPSQSSTRASARRTSSSPPCSTARRSGSSRKPRGPRHDRRRRGSRGHADPGLSGVPRGGSEVARHLPRHLPRTGGWQRGRSRPDRPWHRAAGQRRQPASPSTGWSATRILTGPDAEAAAELLGQTIVGLAQVGARTLLAR